jgi:signal transduction histidine kinase/HAMP domain-containing protein
MFSIVGMLVVLIGYVVAHNLTQPIRRLAEVAQSVAAGDLSQRSLVRTYDEIGVLGRVFDNMTLNLHEKTEALVQSYKEQERKNAFLTAVIASAEDGTVVVDPEGAIMHQNPAAEEIITHDHMLWNYTLRELARETKDAGHALLRLEVDKLWYEAKAAPVVTTDQEEIGVVMTLRDITEEILTDRMRTAFILQMSHELYTPLVTARGYTELAKSTIGNKVPLAHEMLDQSLSSMRELRGMISQILDISRMIRGGFELTTEKLDLAELLYSVIDEYKELAESKNLRLQIDIGPIQSYSGGREPLRWTFRHLIKNAYDYTLPGGLIRITALDEDGCFVLKVRDTGVGIAPHEKPHIFEQFYRGQPVSRDGVVIDTRGAGLGLFVVDQVVRVHEGEVKVWTEQGIGSEFQIRLPR